ncbi:unnamed protein product, partial [Mesorhabditis belari]|uniref:Cyclin-like domain-containing protein n=1 Tax=Mesorhabditis belari TaxID=2138241 RepID=A0AAF3FLC2_9BILA
MSNSDGDDGCEIVAVVAGPSTSSSDDPSTSNLSSKETPRPRRIYEFIIRCCIRLEALNRTACTSILLMKRLYERQIVKCICNYSLATACILIASKSEEDSAVRIRDVVNCAHRILNPDEPAMEVDDTFWTQRRSLGRLEFVVLRELSFETYFEHPHQLLSIYLDTLVSWMPQEFEKFPIKDEVFSVLRDCYVIPEFVLEHSKESVALAVLSLVLKGHNITVPSCRDFYTIFSKHMTEKKLRLLEEEILQDVYYQRLK